MKINPSILNHEKLTVGFSGGRDSVALLHWLHANNYNIDAIHINHNINPNSNAWATFCKNFCNSYNIPITIIDGNITQFGSNIENAARELRHQSFSKIKNPIVLAHHAKDQIETFLFKLFRGAGIEGLTCMKETQLINDQLIIRPMLSINRSEIINYISEHGLGWVEDSSNYDNSFDRNYIRNKLIPIILEKFPAFNQNLPKVIESLNEANTLLNDLAEIDEQYVYSRTGWDIHKLNELTDQRIKNLLKYQLRKIKYYKYSYSILNEFIKIVRNNNPNAHSMFPFGHQRGYIFTFNQ